LFLAQSNLVTINNSTGKGNQSKNNHPRAGRRPGKFGLRGSTVRIIFLRYIGAFAALLMVIGQAHAAVIITAVETGGDVVFSMAGGQSIDLSGLSFFSNISESSRVFPSAPLVLVGPTSLFGDLYEGLTVSGVFGTGFNQFASSGSGITFGVSGGQIMVPTGYVSNTVLGASSATFSGETFASMGIIGGNYVWTLGGVDAVTLQIPNVPIPAAFWLFGSAIGVLGWMRRKKV
jgi:hypothetical protein